MNRILIKICPHMLTVNIHSGQWKMAKSRPKTT